MNLLDKITVAIDKNEFSSGIFIYLAKAFDTVDHRILLEKLKTYEIRGLQLEWLKSFKRPKIAMC